MDISILIHVIYCFFSTVTVKLVNKLTIMVKNNNNNNNYDCKKTPPNKVPSSLHVVHNIELLTNGLLSDHMCILRHVV